MQKTQQRDNYLVTPNKKEYQIISPKYQSIFLSLKINNFNLNPLIVHKIMRSEDCFYMQKTHPGEKEPYETIMGHKISEATMTNGADPIKEIRKLINKKLDFVSKNFFKYIESEIDAVKIWTNLALLNNE